MYEPDLSIQADFEGDVPFDDERALHWATASTAQLQLMGCTCIRLVRGVLPAEPRRAIGVMTSFLAEGWKIQPPLFNQPGFAYTMQPKEMAN